MRCSGCGSDNQEGMKFCGNCGVPLSCVCPSCGYNCPPQFKFCGNCGAALTAPQARDELAKIQKYIPSYLADKIRQSKGRIEGERRNVTVVFSDISGFTPMAEERDPEEASAIVAACHTELGKIIYDYEGIVDKVVGDGLMAIFGVPTHEDDPERAILAAMEMRQGMKYLSQGFEKSMDVSLGLSVGINTGIVIIGDIGTDLRLDYTVMGDVVNTASRLQGEAESGEILVTQETYERAKHCFDFETLEPVRLRGKAQPIHVYRVIQRKEKPLRTRGIEGLRAPLIGRDEEFAICKQVVDQLVAGKGGTLLITGEAGLGKSRLVEELKGRLKTQDQRLKAEDGKLKTQDDDAGRMPALPDASLGSSVLRLESCTWLEGRCVSHSRSINYWVFVDALKNYFDIRSKDNAGEIERKIRRKSEEQRERSKERGAESGERRARSPMPYALRPITSGSTISTISSLLSPKLKAERVTDDLAESEKKLQIFTAVKDVLAAESQLKPMILMLEDLHWADELSIELLCFLMKELSQHRITFICIYRPPIAGETDIYAVQKLEEECLMLDTPPQHPASSIQYPVSRVVLSPLPSGDSNILLQSLLTAEDLPSEIKELILDKSGGNPLYLEEVIRSIIDDKTIEQRNGRWLAVKEVEDIEVPGTVQGVIMARMDRLEEEPKRVLQCASVIGRSFDYDLLSYLVAGGLQASGSGERHGDGRPQALGQSLTRENENVGELPTHGGAERNSEDLRKIEQVQNLGSALDEHLEKLEEMGFIYSERFRGVYATTGRDARDAYATTGSGDGAFGFRHALIQDVAYNTILIRRRKELHKTVGRYIEEVHSSHLDEFYEILAYHYSNSDDMESSLSYLIKAGNKNRESYTGSSESALRYFRKALDILEDSSVTHDNYALHKHGIYDGMGEAYKDLGKYDMALSSFETVLHVTEQMGNYRMKAEALRQIGNSEAQMGNWEAALGTYQESLAIAKNPEDLAQMGLVYNNMGYGYFERGDLDESMKYYQEALGMGEQCDDPRLIGDASNGLGMIAALRHDFDEAIRNYQVSLNSYNELGESHYEAQTYLNLGVTHFKKNEVEMADRYYEKNLKISEKCGYSRLIAYTYLNRAELYIRQSDLDRARDFCDKAFQMLRTLDDRWAVAEGYKSYGMIYRRQRNVPSAEEAFRASLKISEECEHLPNMAEVYREMGLMYREEGMLEEALAHFSKSRDIFGELGIPEEIQKADTYIAGIESAEAAARTS